MSFRRYSIVSNNCFRSSSPGYIANYEEGIKQNVVQLEEKQRIISILTADRDASEEENTRLKDELAEVIEDREAHKKREEEQTETIRKQNEELAILRTAKKKRFERITWWKRLGKFILLTIGYAVLFFLAVLIKSMCFTYLHP